MADSLSDFENKLYSIRPFIETSSPPSSDKKQNQEIDDDIEPPADGFKLPDVSSLRDIFSDIHPLRKVVS